MKVALFGAGYVGCVTAANLASLGHTVWLIEPSETKVSLLKDAQSPIREPGIDAMLGDAIRKKSILPVLQPDSALAEADIALICVGTPSLADGGTDIRQVQTVFQQIINALKNRQKPFTIALRSTVPYPLIKSPLLTLLEQSLPGRYGRDVFFAINPEFLREGKAMDDFMHPPFVVIGTEQPQATESLRALYQGINAPFQVVSVGSASLLKYACNAFHALKVVFTNELASLSSLFEADLNQVMHLFTEDTILNISPAYLKPGYAYGGSCLPKDLKTINRLSSGAGLTTPLLTSIEISNAQLIEKTVQTIADSGVNKIGLIGLTFKAGSDDFRNSPLVELAERLLGKGFAVHVFDPDIDMRRIHGQNLRFIEQRFRHLADHLSPDLQGLVGQSELLVVGKRLPAEQDWLRDVPANRRILDLTRQLRSAQHDILTLEGLTRSSSETSTTR
jgi:GDP-mannose 6-dehydrogenase